MFPFYIIWKHKSTNTMCCLNDSEQLFLSVPAKVRLPWEATAALEAQRKSYFHRQRKQLWPPKGKFSSEKAKTQCINEKKVKYLVSAIMFANSRSSKYCQRRSCLIPKLSILPHYWTEKYFSLCKIQFLYFSLMNTSSFLQFGLFLPFAAFWTSLWILLKLPFLLFLTFLPSSLPLFFTKASPQRHKGWEFKSETILQNCTFQWGIWAAW